MSIINNTNIVGSKGQNLVLETAGKLYVKVADRYYELDFRNSSPRTVVQVVKGSEDATIEGNTGPDLSQYVTKDYLKAALTSYTTKRNWEDVVQTQAALEQSLLEGFTESINPITVQTMQMIVGTANLQFTFLSGIQSSTETSPGIIINDGYQLICPKTYIKHYTLEGPSAVAPETSTKYFARWTIQDNNTADGTTTLDLPVNEQSYYLYIRVPKYNITDEEVEAENYPTVDLRGDKYGTYLVSEEAIAIDSEDGYYYLLCAIITSNGSGGRSIGYTYGYTEILPGQITAYIFKSSDGTQYIDFLNEAFHIGSGNEYFHYDSTNGLVLKGKMTVTGGSLQDTLNSLQSQIDDEVQAWFSDDPNNDEEHKDAEPTLQRWPTKNWKELIDTYIVGNIPLASNWLSATAGGTPLVPAANIYYKVLTEGSYKGKYYKWDTNNNLYSEVSMTTALYNTTYKAHYGDLYYIAGDDSGSAISYKGNAYRFTKTVNAGVTYYNWTEVSDTAIIEALKLSREAKQKADQAVAKFTTWAADGNITYAEIGELRLEKTTLESDYNYIIGQCNKWEVSYTNFTTLYTAYHNDLTNIINAWDSPTHTDKTAPIVLADVAPNLGTNMSAYYNAREPLLTTCATNNKTLIDGYQYLKEAIKGSTTVSGGLVNTSTILLGNATETDVTAGINGITHSSGTAISHAIAAWYGGPMVDHEYSPSTTPYAKTLFRHDGSGYIAGGRIKWDSNGHLVQTDAGGNESEALCYRSEYSTSNNYYKGNIVTYQGSSWVYINSTPSLAPAPVPEEGEYWHIYSSKGSPGSSGEAGYNNAIVNLYSRTNSTITWTNDIVYTFSSATLSPIPSGWSQSIPSGTNPIYVTSASAKSRENTDIIAYNEWSSPIILAENGENGRNVATIQLFQRTNTVPAVPAYDLTYNFPENTLTGMLGNWSRTFPATDSNHYPCYVIQATASSTSDIDIIESREWSSPVIYVRDGDDGSSGPALCYRGEFTAYSSITGEPTYYCNSKRVDVVKYNNVYYKCKIDNYQPTSWISNDWDNFGASFSNIATGVLFSEQAFIDKAVIKKVDTDISPNARIEIGGAWNQAAVDNSMKMYDSTNTERLSIQCSTLPTFYNTDSISLSKTIISTSGSNDQSGTAIASNLATFVTKNNTGKIDQLITFTGYMQGGLTETEITQYSIISFFNIELIKNSTGEQVWAAQEQGIEWERSTTHPGTAETDFEFRCTALLEPNTAYTLRYSNVEWQFRPSSINGSSSFGISDTLYILYPLQKTEIGIDGFRVAYDSKYYFQAKVPTENNPSDFLFEVLANNFGLRCNSEKLGLRINGQWYKTSVSGSNLILTIDNT